MTTHECHGLVKVKEEPEDSQCLLSLVTRSVQYTLQPGQGPDSGYYETRGNLVSEIVQGYSGEAGSSDYQEMSRILREVPTLALRRLNAFQKHIERVFSVAHKEEGLIDCVRYKKFFEQAWPSVSSIAYPEPNIKIQVGNVVAICVGGKQHYEWLCRFPNIGDILKRHELDNNSKCKRISQQERVDKLNNDTLEAFNRHLIESGRKADSAVGSKQTAAVADSTDAIAVAESAVEKGKTAAVAESADIVATPDRRASFMKALQPKIKGEFCCGVRISAAELGVCDGQSHDLRVWTHASVESALGAVPVVDILSAAGVAQPGIKANKIQEICDLQDADVPRLKFDGQRPIPAVLPYAQDGTLCAPFLRVLAKFSVKHTLQAADWMGAIRVGDIRVIEAVGQAHSDDATFQQLHAQVGQESVRASENTEKLIETQSGDSVTKKQRTEISNNGQISIVNQSIRVSSAVEQACRTNTPKSVRVSSGEAKELAVVHPGSDASMAVTLADFRSMQTILQQLVAGQQARDNVFKEELQKLTQRIVDGQQATIKAISDNEAKMTKKTDEQIQTLKRKFEQDKQLLVDAKNKAMENAKQVSAEMTKTRQDYKYLLETMNTVGCKRKRDDCLDPSIQKVIDRLRQRIDTREEVERKKPYKRRNGGLQDFVKISDVIEIFQNDPFFNRLLQVRIINALKANKKKEEQVQSIMQKAFPSHKVEYHEFEDDNGDVFKALAIKDLLLR